MTNETIEEIFADYKRGLSNRKFGASVRFCKRSIIRGCKIKTGNVEKERPALVLTDTSCVNTDLLTNHLMVAPILSRPNNDLSIPILIDLFGDNVNRFSFVDPICESEVLVFPNFTKQITRTQTCPDVVFDLVMQVKDLMRSGKPNEAAYEVKLYRLRFMREHGILSIGYLLTPNYMKYLDADGTERYDTPTPSGFSIDLIDDMLDIAAEPEIPDMILDTDPNLDSAENENGVGDELFGTSTIKDALQRALAGNPLQEVPSVPKNTNDDKIPLQKGKLITSTLTAEQCILFMDKIRSSQNPEDASSKIFGSDVPFTYHGFRYRYNNVCERMKDLGCSDKIAPWKFSDPDYLKKSERFKKSVLKKSAGDSKNYRFID